MLKKLVCLLICIPNIAGAVEGASILYGKDMRMAPNVGADFPRYNIAERCGQAWEQGALGHQTCIHDQTRLAAVTSHFWQELAKNDQESCVRRADAASATPYSVLYSCSKGALFREHHQTTTASIQDRTRTRMPTVEISELNP